MYRYFRISALKITSFDLVFIKLVVAELRTNKKSFIFTLIVGFISIEPLRPDVIHWTLTFCCRTFSCMMERFAHHGLECMPRNSHLYTSRQHTRTLRRRPVSREKVRSGYMKFEFISCTVQNYKLSIIKYVRLLRLRCNCSYISNVALHYLASDEYTATSLGAPDLLALCA